MTKREEHCVIDIGPIDDLEQPGEEINLNEDGNHPKLLNVDETRLEQQINLFKAKTVKPAKQDSNGLKSKDQPILKSALRKNKNSNNKDHNNRNERDCDVSSSESEIINSENPVKVSKSNYKKQVDSTQNYGNENSLIQRKRKYESSTNTGDAIDSLRKDLSKSVVPVSKRSIKRGKRHDHIENDKQVNIKKARKRRQKYNEDLSSELSKNIRKVDIDQESNEQESSSNDSISSTERDELLRKYFRKIL